MTMRAAAMHAWRLAGLVLPIMVLAAPVMAAGSDGWTVWVLEAPKTLYGPPVPQSQVFVPDYDAHPEVVAAAAELAAAGTARMRAWGGWGPQIKGSVEYRNNYLIDNINGIDNPSQLGPQKEWKLELTQPLFRAFTLWDDLRAADAGIAEKHAALAKARAAVKLRSDLAEAQYFSASRRLGLARTFAKEVERVLVAVREKAANEDADPVEMARALATAARAKANQSRAMADLADARSSYFSVWGVMPDTPRRVTAKQACRSIGACEEAARSAHDAIAAQARLAQARIALRRQSAGRAPTIDLIASLSRDDVKYNTVNGLQHNVTDKAEIGLRLEVPMPIGLEKSADMERAAANVAAARARLTAARRRAGGQVRTQWQKREFVAATRRAVVAQVTAARRTLDAVTAMHQAGEMSLKDVTDEQEGLSNALIALERARLAELEAVLRLNALIPNL